MPPLWRNFPPIITSFLSESPLLKQVNCVLGDGLYNMRYRIHRGRMSKWRTCQRNPLPTIRVFAMIASLQIRQFAVEVHEL